MKTFTQDEIRTTKELSKEAVNELIGLKVLADRINRLIKDSNMTKEQLQRASEQLKKNFKFQRKLAESLRQCGAIIQLDKDEALAIKE